MTNIKNYNFTGIDYRINYNEYYDFYLNTDALYSESNINLISSFDFKEITPIDNGGGFGLPNFGDPISGITSNIIWGDSIVSAITITTYGLTGLDNGSIPYNPSIDNFLNTLTGTTLHIPENSNSLILNRVEGYTKKYVYPIELITTESDSIGNYLRFCGGFYQGYYKIDGFDYDVLPNRYEKGFSVEVLLNKSDSVCSGTTGTTLNDLYPNNKGFFYYIGTRAENKFWNKFTGNTTSGCTSGSTDFCTDIKETDIDINNITIAGLATTMSVPLSPPPVDIKLIENQFLIYGRSDGRLCSNEESETGFGQVRAGREFERKPFYSSTIRKEESFPTNPFLIFGRSDGQLCSRNEKNNDYGQTRADRNFSGNTKPITELDKDSDLIGNALGFRIKDDGSIGYRMLVQSGDCKSIEVIEEYSVSGTVTPNKWQHILVKWINNNSFNECDLINGKPRKGRFKFYLNGNLIFTSKELTEFIPKRLDDLHEKQVGVPYNISIGGGTQGLLESMTFDGQDPDDLGLLIEQNFAGSFIGDISIVNLYDNPLDWCQIKGLYKEKIINFT